MTPQQALARFLEIANSYDGIDGHTRPDRLGYICAPNGPPSAAAFFCQHDVPQDADSCCLVFAIGCLVVLLKELGINELQEPLDASGAMGLWARATTLAKAHGAMFSPEHVGPGLRVGSIIHLENGRARHWRILTRDLGDGRWLSMNGGGLKDGYQLIYEAECEIPGGVYDRTSMKPVADFLDVLTLLEALMPADPDPADACLA